MTNSDLIIYLIFYSTWNLPNLNNKMYKNNHGLMILNESIS